MPGISLIPSLIAIFYGISPVSGEPRPRHAATVDKSKYKPDMLQVVRQ
jgi:hypothetical protein